jgi:hypothetical protein
VGCNTLVHVSTIRWPNFAYYPRRYVFPQTIIVITSFSSSEDTKGTEVQDDVEVMQTIINKDKITSEESPESSANDDNTIDSQ